MRIHVIQTGTVAIKQVQRHGSTSGNPVVNILRDPTWTEPLPIYAFVIEHPEGLIVVDTGETARVAEPGYFPWWHPYFRFAVRGMGAAGGGNRPTNAGAGLRPPGCALGAADSPAHRPRGRAGALSQRRASARAARA